MKPHKFFNRKLAALILLVILIAGILLAMQRHQSRGAIAYIAEQPNPTFMLPDNYAYRQDNPDWGKQEIGGTSDTLAAYGCTVSSVAMAASNLLGGEITPESMSTKLDDVNGFTKNGLLIWKHIETATDGKVRAIVHSKPSHENIQSCMSGGGYPVIKIKLRNFIIHWVVIVGDSDNGYLIRDPLIGNPNDPPIYLSQRSQSIYAARCIKTTEP